MRLSRTDLTQAEFAQRIGATRQTVISIEAQKYAPSLELAFRMAYVLDTPIAELFSFDPSGQRRWFFGLGEWQEGEWRFESLSTTSGALFGEHFKPEDVVITDWGSLTLRLDCSGGSATFTPGEGGFEPGTLNLHRLTSLQDLACEIR